MLNPSTSDSGGTGTFTVSPDVAEFPVDDDAVLFSQRQQRIYGLNTTAAFIWRQLSRRTGVGVVVDTIAEALRCDEATASDTVTALIDKWRDCGLIEGGAIRDFVPKNTDGGEPSANNLPAWTHVPLPEERYYGLLSSRFTLRAQKTGVIHHIDCALGHLHVSKPCDVTAQIDLIKDADGRTTLYLDQEPLLQAVHDNQVVPKVKSLIWSTAVQQHDYLLNIHGGVVGDGHHCLIFPAAPGSGKSTLTAGMARAGYEYFSDEVALLESPSFEIRPVPLGLCVKNTGWGVIARLFPALNDMEAHLRGDNKTVKYLPPTSMRRALPERTYPAAGLIFPVYSPDADRTTVSALSRMEALQLLFDQCLSIPNELVAEDIEAVVRWVQETPCHRLEHHSLEGAISAIEDLRLLTKPLPYRAGLPA